MSSGIPSPNPYPPVEWARGTLAQAGDVGTATRGRHDALGGATGDVVVNLSTWRGKRGEGQKQSYRRSCSKAWTLCPLQTPWKFKLQRSDGLKVAKD